MAGPRDGAERHVNVGRRLAPEPHRALLGRPLLGQGSVAAVQRGGAHHG